MKKIQVKNSVFYLTPECIEIIQEVEGEDALQDEQLLEEHCENCDMGCYVAQ
jgi:hypothetical protein